METVSLKQFECFKSDQASSALNRLAEVHSGLMAHQIASATGCSLDEAMSLLLHLAASKVAKPKTLVYHIYHESDPPTPILSLDLDSGPPALPFICPICNEEIEDYSELLFDFVFILAIKLQFRG